MTIFARFSDIVQANVNALLDKADDPKKMVRMLIQELDDALVNLRATAAQHIAEQKRIQRERDALTQSADVWQQKAEKAVSHDRDDLARKALHEKQQILQSVEAMAKDSDMVDAQIEQLSTDIASLQEKAQQARQRQQQLESRHACATVRLQSKQVSNQQKIADSLAKYERFEAKIERIEAEVEAYDLGSKPSLQAEFDKLENESAVEDELKTLHQRVKQQASSQQASAK